jgi:hypothetical protein
VLLDELTILRPVPQLRHLSIDQLLLALASGQAEEQQGLIVPRTRGAGRQFWQEGIFWSTVDGTAIATSTTETVIFPDVTIPGNYMQDGRILGFEMWGRFGTTTGPPTMRYRTRWGGVAGTVLLDSGTITTVASVTAAMWRVEGTIQTRTNGATGTVFPTGEAKMYGAVAPTVGSVTGAPAIASMGSAGILAPAAVTVNLAVDTALSQTAQWSASNAANTLTGHNYWGFSPN